MYIHFQKCLYMYVPCTYYHDSIVDTLYIHSTYMSVQVVKIPDVQVCTLGFKVNFKLCFGD